MKRVILSGLCLLYAVFSGHAQFSRKNTSAGDKKDTLQTTLDLKLTLVSDTSRAKIVLFAKGDTDHFLSWVEGFVIVKSYKLPNGNVAGTIANLAYTSRWELIKPEDIYDVKIFKAEGVK